MADRESNDDTKPRADNDAGPSPGKAGRRSGPLPVKARILLVDDHPLVLDGLAQIVAGETDLEVVGRATSAGEVPQLMESLRPNLVLLDLNLGDGDGLEVMKDVHARFEGVKVLIASMHDDAVYAERALRAGAVGYINKAASREEMTAAIRHVLRGKIYVSEETSAKLLNRVGARPRDDAKPPMETLSDRELSVFEMMGQGIGTREIAEKLHLSVKTVETYREHLKKKLGVASGNELIREAVQWQLSRERTGAKEKRESPETREPS